MSDSTFDGNVAYSGWGGALYGTNTNRPFSITNCRFTRNRAISSYTNKAEGGAIMVAETFTLMISHCLFEDNAAAPHVNAYPRTYSGFGGALVVQSATASISHSNFTSNTVLTGQFDAGSAGGAIVLENANDVTIVSCHFEANGAAGYYSYSTFSEPGSAGAIYVKFSTFNISKSSFFNNWASAGGSAPSIGGAIAGD